MKSDAPRPTWPNTVAVAALVGLAILVPVFAFVVAASYATWPGTERSPTDDQTQFAWLVVGTCGALAAIALALVAAAAGGTSTRVLAAATCIVAIATGGFMGLLAVGVYRTLPQPPAASDSRPTCGPDSRPPVYGGDSRYSPCDDDMELAQSLVPTIVGALPVADVTRASVDDAAARLEADGVTGYEGAVAVDEEVVVAAWTAAPVTCVVAVWSEGAWQISVDGLLVDGGCGLPGIDPRYNSD
jgi:hypothetical protein